MKSLATSSRLVVIKRFTAIILICWTVVVAASLIWTITDENKQTLSLAQKEVLITFNKDRAFRMWATKHGGLYVPITEETPPNPYLTHIPDRDITLPSGKKLTLMNPAYALRQLMHDFANDYGAKGHITSLKPLNPANMPDAWERAALLQFEQGIKEVSEVTTQDGNKFLRLIRPMVTGKDCLKCHAAQGYKIGDIRGGVGVSIPLEPFQAMRASAIRDLLVTHVGIWLVGVVGIGFVHSRSRRNITASARAEQEVRESRERFTNLIETTTDFVWEIDTNGVYTYASPRIRDILGYAPEEVVGRPVMDFMLAADAERVGALFRTAVGDRRPFAFAENVNIHEQGRQVILESSGVPFFDAEGNYLGYRGIARDITERKRTEGENRRLREFFQNISESIPTGVWVADREEVIFYANKAITAITGMSPSAFVGTRVRDYLAAPTMQKFSLLYHQAKETGRPVRYDGLRMADPSGRETYRSGWLIPRMLEERFDGMICTAEDVTEQKKAEQDIALLNFALNAVREEAYLIDQQARLQYVNDEACRALGYGRDGLIGRSVDCVDPDFPAERWTGHWEELKERGSLVFEGRHKARDGHSFPVEVHANYFEYDGHGYNLALARDITERKRTEETLRRTNELLERVFSVSHTLIAYLDRDFNFIRVNEAYAASDNRKPDFFVGKNHFTLYPNEENEEIFRSVIRTGTPYIVFEKAFEYAEHPERGVSYWDWTLQPVKEADGSVEGLVLILQNVTERKQAALEKQKLEQQLQQVQKMESIGTLAGGVAHDFNNILTAIIGYSNILKMKMRSDDPLRASVDTILSSAERAAHLTQSLLAFSRKQIINPKPVDLNAVVRGIDKLLKRLIGEDVDLTTRFSGRGLVAIADAGQIEQVLMNLATNARDAMPQGGILTITMQETVLDEEFMKLHGFGKAGRYALIAVSDTGTGMDARTTEKIFEPFFTTKELGRGTGLGLSIVYGIVKQHNGTITVYSEPDKGTTFKIYLPLVASAVEDARIEPAAPPCQGTETILLAEDDQAVRTLIRTVLEDFGYQVIEAADGQEAIDLFRKQQACIDLLVVDVIMPRKSGKELYDMARELKPGVRAIFMSGYTADIIHKKGIFEEGLEFLSKPINPADLLRKVREVLDKKQ